MQSPAASSSPESLACGADYNAIPKPVVNVIEPPPVCFEARLPPLHPSLSAQLSLLVAGHGSLFAGERSSMQRTLYCGVAANLQMTACQIGLWPVAADLGAHVNKECALMPEVVIKHWWGKHEGAVAWP